MVEAAGVEPWGEKIYVGITGGSTGKGGSGRKAARTW